MLGYVRAYKPELKFKEYDVYKGIYCSLCKTLLRRYSPLGQLFLSYDVTFFALMLFSVSDPLRMHKSRCCYNPTKKCYSCGRNEILDFCADVSVLLFYHKILDNLHDHGFGHKILAVLLLPVAYFMQRKAKRENPEAEKLIREAMQKQSEVEKSGEASLDAAAEPSSKVLSDLAALKVDNPSFRRLFLLLGRFVYLIDAVDDVRDDIQKGDFNPLISKYTENPEHFPDYAMELLNHTMAEMLSMYDRILFRQCEPVVYNVLFYGLYNSAIYVTNSYRKDKKEADR